LVDIEKGNGSKNGPVVDHVIKPVEPSALSKKFRSLEGLCWRRVMERRVVERMDELKAANARLLAEIKERQKAEAKLREALAEKESLLAEIHHRVKNNLQIVSSLTDMAGRRMRDPEARAVCLDLQAKIHGMGLIHTELYRSGNIGRIDIAAYGRMLFHQLADMYEAGGIRPTFDLDELPLPLDKAVPCGMLLNELLSNVFKHAYPPGEPGRVDIRIGWRAEGRAVISIRDYGRGLPQGMDMARTKTFGLRLIRDTVKRQLCGSLQIDSDGGTAVTVEFGVAGGA
jgi:two-component sensor histidine kinase